MVKKEQVFVLFLPQNEIHELGLMFIHMSLLLHGYSSIYLGQSIPLACLTDMHKLHDQINFISYFTIMPPTNEVNQYLQQIHEQVLRPNKDLFYVLGKKMGHLKIVENQGVKTFSSIQEILNTI